MRTAMNPQMVTSFGYLPEVEQLQRGRRMPVIAGSGAEEVTG